MRISLDSLLHTGASSSLFECFGELRFALGTLQNFGYFINIQGDEITMVRSQSIMPAAVPNIQWLAKLAPLRFCPTPEAYFLAATLPN